MAAIDSLRYLPGRATHAFRKGLKSMVRMTGYEITRQQTGTAAPARAYPQDFTQLHIDILSQVAPYTLTSGERIFSLIEAVSYVATQNIPGAIVECGVWKGGSMMASALTLKHLNSLDRELYLFDTFEGMPKPLDVDVHANGQTAMDDFLRGRRGEDSSAVCYAALNEVKAAMGLTGYPAERVHFVRGKVEDTIPGGAPETIALLRLDTDWYESTKHELEHLYPRLSPGGILIIDDYGDWQGARKATDEYIGKYAPGLFLSRIDDTGRLAVKPA